MGKAAGVPKLSGVREALVERDRRTPSSAEKCFHFEEERFVVELFALETTADLLSPSHTVAEGTL